MSNAFVAPHFQTPELAREWLEKTRWPEGPICSHCGTFNHAYKTKKAGWYRCAEKECRKDFTVTTGTVMERSHIPLNKWLMGFYLMSASKKGVSAHQLHRALASTTSRLGSCAIASAKPCGTITTPALIRSAARAKSWRPTRHISAQSRKPSAAPRPQAAASSPRAAGPARQTSAPLCRW